MRRAAVRRQTQHGPEGGLKPLPTGVFLVFVGGVCLALAASGLYTVATLNRLETAFLENRAGEMARTLDQLARGPGRRNNPEVWQRLLAEAAAGSRGSVTVLALLDGSGASLARAGDPDVDAVRLRPGVVTVAGRRIFVHDFPLVGARQGMSGAQSQVSGWRLRVGIPTAEAGFVRSQAWIQVVVTGVAIAALLFLTGYLLRALRHYLEYQRRESSERHLRALGTMAATLAHEIRNPLGAMKGLTQLAQEELAADHKAQGMMQTVVAEAQRLERLVTDLLLFARQPAPRIGPLNLPELLEGVRILAEERLRAKSVALELLASPGLEAFRSDAELLRQMLLNVVFNAIDASPPGASVTLRASLEDRTGRLALEVCDSGPGIPEGDVEELFQPFRTGKVHGTGLGLAVSRQISESLGGSIRLQNRSEGGARCIMQVPAGRA